MSIIQKIQEKYAKLMAIIIALALMIFVVMLAFENGGNLFGGGPSSTVGKVNGVKIGYDDFIKKVEQYKSIMESQYGPNPSLHEQSVNTAWNQEINRILLNSELKKVGMKVGKKELGDILYGANPPADLKRIFSDTATGLYNAQLAKQNIDQMLRMKKGTPEQMTQREQLVIFIKDQESRREDEKYNSLLGSSINYPKWFIEKQIADNSQMATISLVRDSYAANADSTIKVSDKEIEDYYKKKEKDYKQPEEYRSIAYVAFTRLASSADTAAARNKVGDLRAEFDTTQNMSNFLASQSGTPFYDRFLSGKSIQIPVKDSIFKLPIGGIYGPYLDGGSFTFAKLMATRQQADSVKVRHILVETAQRDPQTGQLFPTRDTATARKLIDSIHTAIRNGSNFDSLCLKLSEDPGKNDQATGKFNGGVYDNVYSGKMVPEFDEFIFGKPVGSKGVVKTDFGYHYIEVLSNEGTTTAYKIAYLSKAVEASQETDNNASNEAALFAGNSRDQKAFDVNAEKLLKEKGINKGIVPNITASNYNLQGLGSARPLIKAVFNARVGQVLEPQDVGTNYVVAVVTEVIKEGTKPLTMVRTEIESVLRNKKIAEKLKQKIGTVTTLEAAASALGGKPIEPVDSLRMTGSQPTQAARQLSNDPKVIGAAFNPANRGKVVPEVIEGRSGVVVIRVDNVTATPVVEANVAEQRKAKALEGKSRATSALQFLRNAATIKDRRIEFF